MRCDASTPVAGDEGPERGLAPLAWAAPGDASAREALRTALRELEGIEHSGRADERVSALTQVAAALTALSAHEAAETYLVQALRGAVLLPAADLRVDLLCRLAESACARAGVACAGDDRLAVRRLRERARDRAFEAAALAGSVADPMWEARVLLRVADVLECCGDHDDALSMQSRVLALLGLGTDRSDGPAVTLPAQLM